MTVQAVQAGHRECAGSEIAMLTTSAATSHSSRSTAAVMDKYFAANLPGDIEDIGTHPESTVYEVEGILDERLNEDGIKEYLIKYTVRSRYHFAESLRSR